MPRRGLGTIPRFPPGRRGEPGRAGDSGDGSHGLKARPNGDSSGAEAADGHDDLVRVVQDQIGRGVDVLPDRGHGNELRSPPITDAASPEGIRRAAWLV